MVDELADGASRGVERFSLTGKVAMVTGASRGIGEATARCYAAQGRTSLWLLVPRLS